MTTQQFSHYAALIQHGICPVLAQASAIALTKAERSPEDQELINEVNKQLCH
ncbi:MAG: hypothetical protein AAGF24_14970 [Cyanobacteria bacterium P01_H01_bin.121]